MSDSEKPIGPSTLPILSESPTQEEEEESRAEQQPPAQAQVQFQEGGYGW